MDLSAQLLLQLKTLVQMQLSKKDKEEKDQFNIHLKKKLFWILWIQLELLKKLLELECHHQLIQTKLENWLLNQMDQFIILQMMMKKIMTH